MKLGWILSMLIPKCPQIIDFKTKRSLKDYVTAQVFSQTFCILCKAELGQMLLLELKRGDGAYLRLWIPRRKALRVSFTTQQANKYILEFGYFSLKILKRI